MKATNKKSEEERRKRGLTSLELVGWSVPPHYDPTSKRLEWGTKLQSPDGAYTVNYTSRILGRHGYMAATLVTSLDSFTNDVAEYRNLLRRFEYTSGEKYSEFKQGDRVAEYGLAALVAGGAAAAVLKSKGIGKLIWVLIAVGAAVAWGVITAVWGFIKRLFSRK